MGGDLIVLGFPLQQNRQGGFLGGLHDLRVKMHQCTVDTFRLYLYGFGLWRQVVADEQGRAVVKVDGHITGAAPFAGTGGRADFAGLAAKRLRDYINLALQGQVFVASYLSAFRSALFTIRFAIVTNSLSENDFFLVAPRQL